jgi:hypothetical protein
MGNPQKLLQKDKSHFQMLIRTLGPDSNCCPDHNGDCETEEVGSEFGRIWWQTVQLQGFHQMMVECREPAIQDQGIPLRTKPQESFVDNQQARQKLVVDLGRNASSLSSACTAAVSIVEVFPSCKKLDKCCNSSQCLMFRQQGKKLGHGLGT